MRELSAKLYSNYLFAKEKAKSKLEEMMSSEDGMEVIEVVILIAVALLIVGLVVNFLTKDGFEVNGNKMGLIQFIFEKIKAAIVDALNIGGGTGGGTTTP